MQLAGEAKIGFGLTLLFGAGTSAVLIAPQEQMWIGWVIMTFSVAGLIALLLHHFWRPIAVLLSPATWTPEGKVKQGKTRAAVGAAVFLIVLGGIYATLHRPDFLFRKQSPIQPAPHTIAPPKPWVTSEEFEAQRKLGRTLLRYSPAELIKMAADGQDIYLFLNNWIKIDYRTSTIPHAGTAPNADYDAIGLHYINVKEPLVIGAIEARFNSKKWRDKILNIGIGTELIAFCQVQDIVPGSPFGPYNIRRDTMIADNCELP